MDIMKSSTHKIGYRVKLKLQITQHSRDYQLINSLVKEKNIIFLESAAPIHGPSPRDHRSKKKKKTKKISAPQPGPPILMGGYLGCGILIEVFNRPAVDFIVTASEAKFVGPVGRPTFSDIDSNP